MQSKLKKLQELYAKNAKIPLQERMADFNKRLGAYTKGLTKIQTKNGIKVTPKEVKTNHGTKVGVIFKDMFKDAKTYEKREAKAREEIGKLVEQTLIAPDAVVVKYICHETELVLVPQDLKFGPIVDEYFADDEQQKKLTAKFKK